jgi:alpha-amylase
MPDICLCYQIHEPYQLRRYTVFDMGQNSIYENDDYNCDTMLHNARQCYLPANELMMRLIRRHKKKFKVAFSFSGTVLDQFEQYAPEVLESFQALVETGCVEVICETSAHSLAFLYSREEFTRQVKAQAARIRRLFRKRPSTFVNTACIYNNDLAAEIQNLGFKTILADGADHVLGWRSANWLYRPSSAPKLALLLRNIRLSEDIGLRFSERSWTAWPLLAETFAAWCHEQAENADIINIYNDYHIFGLRHGHDSGIFEFMDALPDALLADKRFRFTTPSAAARKLEAKGEIDVPQFMSWEEEGRDLTSWLGNDMQKDAIHALYALAPHVHALRRNTDIIRDYEHLQTSNHFYHISTKWFSRKHADRPSPFDNPYDAYITYMNVLADFEMRLDAMNPGTRTATKAGSTKKGSRRKKGNKAAAAKKSGSKAASARTPGGSGTAPASSGANRKNRKNQKG